MTRRPASPLLCTPHDLGLPSKFAAFRGTQSQGIVDIAGSEQQNVICNMPTGTGKTAAAVSVAVLEGKRALFLTATKSLQSVYADEFVSMGMADVRGANNYSCPALLPGGQFHHLNITNDPDPRADIGPCLAGMECGLRGGGCPRFDAIRVAKKSSMVVSNYDCWIAAGKQEERARRERGGGRGRAAAKAREAEEYGFGKFDIIFLDEYHSAAEKVSDAMRVELDLERLHKLLDGVTVLRSTDSIARWTAWSRAILVQIANVWDEVKEDVAAGLLSHSLMRELREIQAVYRMIESMSEMDDEWAVDTAFGGRVITFEPVWPGRYCERLLYRGIAKRVGMSATIRPPALRYVGIKTGEYDFFEYDSPFPVAQRLVWQWPAVQLNYKTERLPDTQRTWAAAIDRLRRDRADRNGIGHSVSYRRAETYAQFTDEPDGLMTYEKGKMAETLRRFRDPRAYPGSFLFGPSHDTGLDFPMCVDEQTKILTADLRWLPAGDLQIGDRLGAFDEQRTLGSHRAREWREAEVTSNRMVKQDRYRLVFSDGTEVIASADHGWMVRNCWQSMSWVRTRRLAPGPDHWSYVVKLIDVWKPRADRDAGYLAAAFDGEGNLYQAKTRNAAGRQMVALAFTQCANEMLSEVWRTLGVCGYHPSLYEHSRSEKNPKWQDCYSTRIIGTSNILRFLGEIRPDRLLPKLRWDRLGCIQKIDAVTLEAKEKLPKGWVVGLSTSTKTYIAEGLASHNSQAEYGILAKTPYPPMDSVLMLARMKDDNQYASVYAADKIVQMTGRGSRSETDSFESVLLDSSVGALLKQWEKFPRWHRKAWRFTRDAPKPPRRLR